VESQYVKAAKGKVVSESLDRLSLYVAADGRFDEYE